jgi:hypothetical protein
VTTSRRSVKAAVWRRERSVAGLVQAGRTAVSFGGVATTYDALDVGTWERSVLRSPALARAAVRFSRKNARFFAGYAVDAHRVPMSWTPPGRVFVEIELRRGILLAEDGAEDRWGRWRRSSVSRPSFRADRRGTSPIEALPEPVREALGQAGRGAMAFGADGGSLVLPADWALDETALYASVRASTLELAGLEDPSPPVALVMDRPSWWRARSMVGAMVRGRGEISIPGRLRTGSGSARQRVRLTGAEPTGAALVRLRPERLVWWSGWESGTVPR